MGVCACDCVYGCVCVWSCVGVICVDVCAYNCAWVFVRVIVCGCLCV